VPWVPENLDPNEGQDWGLQGAKDRAPRLLKSLFLDDGALAGQNLKLQAKYAAMQAEVDQEMFLTEDAELIVVAFGSIGRIAKSTVRKLRAQGHKVGLVRPITLFPFPSDVLLDLAKQGKRFLTIEHNMGQMVEDVRLSIRTVADSAFHCQLPGNLPTPDDFEEPILKALEG
jgi:2-oxoglutarate ferredoxin oxidoreductase subunit alpha